MIHVEFINADELTKWYHLLGEFPNWKIAMQQIISCLNIQMSVVIERIHIYYHHFIILGRTLTGSIFLEEITEQVFT